MPPFDVMRGLNLGRFFLTARFAAFAEICVSARGRCPARWATTTMGALSSSGLFRAGGGFKSSQHAFAACDGNLNFHHLFNIAQQWNFLGAAQCNGLACASGTGGTTNTVDIVIGHLWQ